MVGKVLMEAIILCTSIPVGIFLHSNLLYNCEIRRKYHRIFGKAPRPHPSLPVSLSSSYDSSKGSFLPLHERGANASTFHLSSLFRKTSQPVPSPVTSRTATVASNQIKSEGWCGIIFIPIHFQVTRYNAPAMY